MLLSWHDLRRFGRVRVKEIIDLERIELMDPHQDLHDLIVKIGQLLLFLELRLGVLAALVGYVDLGEGVDELNYR